MHILGISAFYHDAAACLIKDSEIVATAQEERFTRKKHDSSFPLNAIEFCLDYGGLSINEVDAIVFYDKPLLKYERLLETYYAFAPRGFKSFLTAMPVWIKDKVFLKKLIHNELSTIGKTDKKSPKLLFTEHHLSHAASAFFPSPFKESAIVTIDGVGEWATASISHGKDNNITILKELRFPHSLGLLYTAFTYYLGFKVNSGEYKLMGLSPYGDSASDKVEKYIDLIYSNLIDVKEDGSIWLNQEYFNYATGLKMIKEKKFKELFGFPTRKPESEILQEHCNLAMAVQTVTENIVLKMAGEAKKLTNSRYLSIAGGVALNCVANGKLLQAGMFDDIWIQPAAGDAGGALGAAYAAYYMYSNKLREVNGDNDKMQGSYLGPEFSDSDIEQMAKKYKAEYEFYNDFDKLCSKTAELLDEGNVIGWFQGRMEWGPRTLGNRSILGDARNPEMQKRLNLKVKFRETFRPFAPSVLYEDVGEYFGKNHSSPYMLFIMDVLQERRKPLPDGYASLPLKEKLYCLRSDIPAITHLDYSARVQTVHKETNPKFWNLLKNFKDRTGYSVIVNTSFNVRGEPIVCTPEDAYKCFMKTEIDYLIVGNYLFSKKR